MPKHLSMSVRLYHMSDKILQQIAADVALVKEKVQVIEDELIDLSFDLHEIKPEYEKRLRNIEKEGVISKEQFEQKFDVTI